MGERALRAVTIDRADKEPELLRAAFDHVLRPSFSPAELPGWEPFVAGIGPDGGEVVVVTLDGDEVVGAGVTTAPIADVVTLLGYLATRPGLRSGGVGAFTMDRLDDLWRAADACLVVAEVHDPRVHPTTDDERPDARLRFYERRGSTVIRPWVQPALVAGAERVEGMLLLSVFESGAPVPDGILGTWADLYYEFCEGHVPTTPEYAELRRRLVADGPASRTPIADYRSVELLAPPST